jgi:hypothetical protein
MKKELPELLIILSLEDSDPEELDNLTRELKMEIGDLDVETVENVSAGTLPEGTKAVDWASMGQIAVSLAPTVIPPLFGLLKSWIERKPSTPVKIKVRVGKKTAQIEYDPTKTTAKDLDTLVKSLGRSLKK